MHGLAGTAAYAQVALGLERTWGTAAPRLRHGDLSLEPKGTLAGSISAVARPPLSYLPLRVLDGILQLFALGMWQCYIARDWPARAIFNFL